MISRRTLLGAGLGTSAAIAAGCQKRPMLPPGAKIIIVGAGFAGIGAARLLQAGGYEVQILEARDRIGGRAHTSGAFGTNVDLGASWLHYGKNNAMAMLALQSRVPFHISDYRQSAAFNLAADPVTSLNVREARSGYDFGQRFKEVLGPDYRKWRMGRLFGASGSGKSIEDIWPEMMRGVDPMVADAYRLILESQYGLPLSEQAMEMMYLGGDSYNNFEWLMTGGMQNFAKWLASDLDIKTNCRVTEISWDHKGATVQSARGSMAADGVILTSSIGLLKSESIKLSPGLPETHKTVLKRLTMALLNKVALKYPATAWSVDAQFWMMLGGDLPCTISNHAAWSGEPVLTAAIGGQLSRDAESWSDEEIAGRLHRSIEKAFGQSLPEPEDMLVTRWSQDPYALGSYSGRLPGANLNEDNVLARPIDKRLFLAGEAIIDDYDLCNASGAFRSGERAADQIMGLV